MNVIEYRDVFVGDQPTEGICPHVKDRGMVIGPDCINCDEFYKVDREVQTSCQSPKLKVVEK